MTGLAKTLAEGKEGEDAIAAAVKYRERAAVRSHENELIAHSIFLGFLIASSLFFPIRWAFEIAYDRDHAATFWAGVGMWALEWSVIGVALLVPWLFWKKVVEPNRTKP